MYERKHHALALYKIFIRRVALNLILGIAIILFSLGLGMVGYRYFENMSWVDSYENAAMILSGMGPVETITTVGGKIFVGTYALLSGIVFLVVIAIISAPIFHRFFHNFLINDSKK